MVHPSSRHRRGNWFLLSIAGLGGLLYGVDVGIIAAALLYLGKTIDLSVAQTSYIVAAVLGGSMVASPVAGVLADWAGRKKMMVVSGIMFVGSVILIILSHSFIALLLGRLLQGMSSGVIAVVAPLYLAECLSPQLRGRGTAIFQFALTIGIVFAAIIGMFYTRRAENTIRAVHSNPALLLAAEDRAWRGMFQTIMYPGIAFFLGSLALGESPRWLFRRGRREEARTALERALSKEQAEAAMMELEAHAAQKVRQIEYSARDSLFQRKYVIPFLLTCSLLALTQATGVNSILGFLVVILKCAGLTPQHTTEGDFAVKTISCLMTIAALFLIDTKGRKVLLKWGTGGAAIALAIVSLLFYRVERQSLNFKAELESTVRNNHVTLPLNSLALGSGRVRGPAELTVLYSYGTGAKLVSVRSNDKDPVLRIEPDSDERGHTLVIERAYYRPIPTEKIGWWMTACLALFMGFFAIGPGVVSWLILSELMPTRIRSIGMGVSLVLNQGVSTFIASTFLSVVDSHGYSTMFLIWAVSTAIYFLIAALFLPETKGKSLEVIETYFEKRACVRATPLRRCGGGAVRDDSGSVS